MTFNGDRHLTPPVGMRFTLRPTLRFSVAGVREILPFYVPFALSLIIIFVPPITMILPDLLMGR
jgi:TRAP-type C4-dicarboxylate transport system permease large subunit